MIGWDEERDYTKRSFGGCIIVQHYYFTSVCLQTAIKRKAISSYTASDDLISSRLIVAKHAHVFVPYYRGSCHSHASTYGAAASTRPHIRRRCLPLVDVAVQRPQWYVSMPVISFHLPYHHITNFPTPDSLSKSTD
jgi:hypothetical protein